MPLDDLAHTEHAHEFVGAEHGEATFRIGESPAVVEAGNVVVSPPGEAHGFVNSGAGELRLVAIPLALRHRVAGRAGSRVDVHA